MEDGEQLNKTILEWANDPDGGGMDWRAQTRDNILAHDPTCKSLDDVWLPRRNGVSCPSDWFNCESCNILFANEVTYGWIEEIDNFDGYYCECCWRRKNG